MANHQTRTMKRFAEKITKAEVNKTDILADWRDLGEKNKLYKVTNFRYYKKDKRRKMSKGPSLLHLAVAMEARTNLALHIIREHPELIGAAREDREYMGQTPFHIAIAYRRVELVRAMLAGLDEEEKRHILEFKTRFKATTMMGELPLSVAAAQAVQATPVEQGTISLSMEIIDILWEAKADPSLKDSKGNTVFHTLVLYAYYYKHKTDNVINVLEKLMGYVKAREEENPERSVINRRNFRSMFLMENEEGLTPLRIAAKHGLKDVFYFLLEYDGLYKHLDASDGVFDICDYDITEIDRVAMKYWMTYMKELKDSSANKTVRGGGLSQEDHYQVSGCLKNLATEVALDRKQSVLDMICNLPIQTASEMLQIHTIEEVIYLKWKRYRWFYWIWGFFHLLLMSLLTTHAIFKAAAIRNLDLVPVPYIIFVNYICIIIAAVYTCLEVMRVFVSHQPLYLTNLHHNGIYRVQFLLFSICLLSDGIWNLLSINNNYFLIAALLLGWWFIMFFFRGMKHFSFFTVMINRIIFGDVLRFSTIIFFQLISFTAAMHVTLLYSPAKGPLGFTTYWTSLMTMFKLMIGLEEMDDIENSVDAWLAIILFILFLIVTYILLLNALIAMMSKTCEMTSNDRVGIWKLQLLSVILFIEGTLLQRHRLLCGRKLPVNLYDADKQGLHREHRFFLKVNNVSRDLMRGVMIDINQRRNGNSNKRDDGRYVPRQTLPHSSYTVSHGHTIIIE